MASAARRLGTLDVHMTTVYIGLTKSGVIKVGMTNQLPETRAAQWKIDLLWLKKFAKADDAAKAEKKLIAALEKHRSKHQPGREWFDCSVAHAVETAARLFSAVQPRKRSWPPRPRLDTLPMPPPRLAPSPEELERARIRRSGVAQG